MCSNISVLYFHQRSHILLYSNIVNIVCTVVDIAYCAIVAMIFIR